MIVKIWMIENDHVFIGYKKKKRKERKKEANVISLNIVQNFVNFDKLPAFVISS